MSKRILVGLAVLWILATGICTAGELKLDNATVMHDGRMLRLDFRGPWPKLPSGPDWLPAYEEGLQPSLSTGARLRHVGCLAVDSAAPFNCRPTLGLGAETAPVLPKSQYHQLVVYKDGKGGNFPSFRDWKHIVTPAEKKKIYFFPVPTGFTADVYLAKGEDRTADSLRLYKADLPAGTNSILLDKTKWANPEQRPPLPACLVWYDYWAIDRPQDAVLWGQRDVTVTVPAKLLRDDLGNATAAANNLALTNRSAVDRNGFTTQRWPLNEGRVFYVSSSQGNDANPGSKQKPLCTIGKAMTFFRNARTGFRVRLLHTDVFHEGIGIRDLITCTLDDPFIIEPYTLDGTPPTSRPVISEEFHMFNPWSCGVVIRGLEVTKVVLPAGFDVGGGMDVIYDDCVLKAGLGLSGFNLRNTVLRCIMKYGAQNALVAGTDLLLSQCVAYRGGYGDGSPGRPAGSRNIFEHNYYIHDHSLPTVVWANFIYQGGGNGIQMRHGGIVADSVLWRNAIQAFVAGYGGGFLRNVMDKAEDISPKEPRGLNMDLISTSETLVLHSAFNIVVNPVGRQPKAMGIIQSGKGYMPDGGGSEQVCARVYVRNNTFRNAGAWDINSSSKESCYRLVVQERNLQSAGPTKMLSGSGPGGPPYADSDWSQWYHSDYNVLSSDQKNAGLANWRKATKSEEHSLTDVVPQFLNPEACPDGYAQSLKLKDEEAFMQRLTNRPPGVWDETYQAETVYDYYRQAFTPTNLPKLDDSKTGFYGASDYRTRVSTNTPTATK